MNLQAEILTVQEMASFLKVKPVTIYKMAAQGRVPAFRVAKSWRFHRPTIEKWLTGSKKYGQTSDSVVQSEQGSGEDSGQ